MSAEPLAVALDPVQWVVEVELSGYGNGWTDISADLLADAPITWGRGFRGNNPSVNTASPGTLTFSLNNGPTNSAGTRGYYGPWNVTSSRRVGWRLGIRVRFRDNPARTDPTYLTTIYEFYGYITRIDPAAGTHVRPIVRVTAGDLMDLYGRTVVYSGLQTLIGQTHATVFNRLYTTLPVEWRGNIEYQDEQYTFSTVAYALDTVRRDRPTVISEMQKLASSVHGRAFVTGSNCICLVRIPSLAHAGSNWGNTYIDSGITFTTADLTAARFPADRSTVVNTVRGAITKRTVDAVNVTLFQVESNFNPPIGPGKSFKLKCQFSDPNQTGQRIGGASIVAPVATTDYTFNSDPSGAGTNLTASVTVSVVANGADAVATFRNNHATLSAYMTSFKIRGKGLYTYQQRRVEYTDSNSESVYGTAVVQVDLSYVDTLESVYAVGDDFDVTNDGMLRDIVRNYAVPVPQSPCVTFIADTTAKRTAFFLDLAESSIGGGRPYLVHISEENSGVDADFIIIGMEKSYDPRTRALTCTWYLEPYGPVAGWMLGTSQLGVDTVLA